MAIPDLKLKFFVDIYNTTGKRLDLGDLEIELRASPRADPTTVALRKDWSYRWPEPILLDLEKRITLPIVPESRETYNPQLRRVVTISEFPLEMLKPGEYAIRAWVNDRFSSAPYFLKVPRPDLVPRPINPPASGHARG